MNMKIIAGMLGAVSLLTVSLANAAIVSLTPSTSTIVVGDAITLTAAGTEFTTGMTLGSLRIVYDPTSLSLTSTAQEINVALLLNGLSTFGVDTSTPGLIGINSLATDFGVSIPGPDLPLFDLNFIAIPPPSVSNIAVDLFPGTGSWFDANDNPLAVSYNGASVTVNAVPVPPALWLFGSGLLGLVGVARRRSTKITA